MKSSINFRFQCPIMGCVPPGFAITEKYIVAVGRTCIVHSLQCQSCQNNDDQICTNHHAEIDVGQVSGVDFYPRSNLMLTSVREDSGGMKLWDLETGTNIRTFAKDKASICRVLFLGELKYASGGMDHGEIMLWEREETEPAHVLRGHTERVARMETRGNLLFSGSEDKTVRIWDTITGACIQVLEGHSGYVSVLNFSPDPNYSLLRAGSGRNGEVRIWDWRQGRLVAECKTDGRTPIVFANINGNIVNGGLGGLVRIWTQEGTLLRSFRANEEPMRAVFQMGRFLITVGTRDGRIKVWDYNDESEMWLFDLQDSALGLISLAAMNYGKLAIASRVESERLHHVQVWEVDKIEELALSKIPTE